MLIKAAIEYPVYRGRSEHNAQHMALCYFVGRSHFVVLEDRTQQLHVRFQKCTDLCSNYSRSELEMCVLYTQWLSKPSHYVQRPIEWKQATSVLLGTSRHIYDHQNTARIIGIPRKRRHCAALSIFVVRCTKFAVFFYVALSRRTKVMGVVLTDHAVASVVAPYERILGTLQTCPFCDKWFVI